MTVAVVRFGGSNCDRDAVRALERLGVDADIAWHEDGLPPETDGVVVPGGFSYGDYLRAGAMAARSPRPMFFPTASRLRPCASFR